MFYLNHVSKFIFSSSFVESRRTHLWELGVQITDCIVFAAIIFSLCSCCFLIIVVNDLFSWLSTLTCICLLYPATNRSQFSPSIWMSVSAAFLARAISLPSKQNLVQLLSLVRYCVVNMDRNLTFIFSKFLLYVFHIKMKFCPGHNFNMD